LAKFGIDDGVVEDRQVGRQPADGDFVALKGAPTVGEQVVPGAGIRVEEVAEHPRQARLHGETPRLGVTRRLLPHNRGGANSQKMASGSSGRATTIRPLVRRR